MVDLKEECNVFMSEEDLNLLDEYLSQNKLDKIRELLNKYDNIIIDNMLHCEKAFDILDKLQ